MYLLIGLLPSGISAGELLSNFTRLKWLTISIFPKCLNFTINGDRCLLPNKLQNNLVINKSIKGKVGFKYKLFIENSKMLHIICLGKFILVGSIKILLMHIKK